MARIHFIQDTLYCGSNTGLYQSTDSGQTWTQKNKVATTQIASDPKKAVMYANLVGVGIVASTDEFTTYSAINPADNVLAQSQSSSCKWSDRSFLS